MSLLPVWRHDYQTGGGLQPDVQLDPLTQQDFLREAAQRETPLGQYLSESARQGFDETLLGRAVEEFQTPRRSGALDQRNTTGLSANARMRAKERPEFGEEQWKASPYYRPGIPYSPSMTEERAAAIAESHDRRRWRDSLYERYQGGIGGQALGLAAQLAGSALDPVNYVPVLGPATRAYAASRLGVIAGYAATTALDASINAAIVSPMIYSDLAARGEDVGLGNVALDIALSGVAGGLFGTAGGALARRNVARSMNQMSAARQLEALNAAVDAVARDEPVNVGPIVGRDAQRSLGSATARSSDDVLSSMRERVSAAAVAPRDRLDVVLDLWQQGRQWPTSKPTEPSLLQFLKSRGGLQDSGGELSARDLPKMRPGLVSARGRSLDDAALNAWEAGYIGMRGGERPSLDELLAAIDDELAGNRRYPEGREPEPDFVALVDEEIARLGIDTEGKSRAEIKQAILQAREPGGGADAVGPVREPDVEVRDAPRSLADIEAEDAELDEFLSQREAAPITLADLDRIASERLDVSSSESPEPLHPSITEAEARLPLMRKERSELDGLARDMGLGDSLDDIPELQDVEIIKRDARVTPEDEAELAAATADAKAAEGYAEAYETLAICTARFAA